MKRIFMIGALLLLTAAAVAFTWWFVDQVNVPVLNPKGWVGIEQKDLVIVSTILMLIVVLPALIMTFLFAWKYRRGKKGSVYKPNWDNDFTAELIWWGLPFIIVAILSVLVWKSSHQLDPFRQLQSKEKEMKIQVVALQWKWLFIYPEQQIASVNLVKFPANRPIVFEITADAPMNSFWIPQLGGQIYAMTGMRTELHLIADEPGSYRGSSANLSGSGFSGMFFTAEATTEEGFDEWVEMVSSSSDALDMAVYSELAKPSSYNPVETYVLADPGLFNQIIEKFMKPQKAMDMKP